jgi:hypothetical protein
VKRGRTLIAAVAVALAALAVYALGFRGSALDPVSLLATNPSLPRTWTDTANGDASTRIRWREQGGVDIADPSGCGWGRGAIRGWSDGGSSSEVPDAYEMVCVYRSRLMAWTVYKWQSLEGVAGEDWPNFEPSSDARVTPKRAASRVAISAEAWEVGCGLGDPDKLCAVWVFRARYDEALVVMELRTITPGLPFAAMERFIESADHEFAAKIASGGG